MKPVALIEPSSHHRQAKTFFIEYWNPHFDVWTEYSEMAFRSVRCNSGKPLKKSNKKKILWEPVAWMEPYLCHKWSKAFVIECWEPYSDAATNCSEIAFGSVRCNYKKTLQKTQILKINFDETSI